MVLRRKILMGYSLVLGLIVIVGMWAVVNLYQLGSASEAILQENYRSILAAENMINALERQDSSVLLLMLGFRDEANQQFRRNEVEFLQWLSRAKDNITLENEAETLQVIEQGYVSYLKEAAQLFKGSADDPSFDTATFYHQTLLPAFLHVRDASIDLREMNQEAMLLASDRAQMVARRAIWSVSGLGLAMAALGLALSLLLANILTRPLKQMTQAAGQIAEGNYEVSLPVQSGDELGQLAQEITTMSHKLKGFHDLNVSHLMAEKRRSEAIIRSINDGILVVDGGCQIIALNPMAAQIFNTTPEAAEGKHFFEISENQTLYHYLRETADTGQAPQLDETASTLVLERGDHTLYYRFLITPVKTGPGPMLGVVLLLQDLTKLKTLDRLKSEFVMTASHELRTPLTSIAMSIGLLAENASEKLSGNERDLLQAAQEDVQRLRTLVNNLLDLSKIESGRMEMEFEPVQLSLLAERAVTALATQAREKAIELTKQVPEDLPPVKADPTKIAWMLTNLMANALRYTEPGGHICLSAEQAHNFIYVSVTDDGAGIPLEYQSKIFDKFVQVKSDKAVGGTGLGLAICKEIIKAHGGTIWVESTPGQGSTFTFMLPVLAGDRRPAAEG